MDVFFGEMGIQVIQHLLEVTESISERSLREESSPGKKSTKLEKSYSDVTNDEHTGDHYYAKEKSEKTSRNISSVSSGRDLLSREGSHRSHHSEDWHADLLGCCVEPGLSPIVSTLMKHFEQEKDADGIGAEGFMEILKTGTDVLSGEVFESLIRTYLAAEITSPMLHRKLKMEKVDVSEPIKDVVCIE